MKKIDFLLSINLCFCCISGFAQFDTLHNFNRTLGSYPIGSLTYTGGLLYGMTAYGGANNLGCIFSIKPDGTGYSDLLDFNGTNGDNPQRSLTLSSGILYGMTYNSGPSYDGNIFSYNPMSNAYKVILNFNGTNGEYPYGDLIVSGNIIYGMTSAGGLNNDGCIFSIDTSGSNYKDLHDYYYPNGQGDGGLGALTLLGNKLFGMTYNGGAGSVGYIFSIDTNGAGYSDLFDFNGTNGSNPQSDLTLFGGKFYGTTELGGLYADGVIFSIDTNGSGYTDMHDFNGTDGEEPFDDVKLSGGILYGMTTLGGASNNGCIFSIDTNGSGYSDILDFNSMIYPEGKNPYGNVTFIGNTWYGMTYYGGSNDYGVIFKDSSVSTSQKQLSVISCQLSVEPNPSNGLFTIKSSVVSNQWSVEVYNVPGEMVFSHYQITKSSNYQIDLSNQPDGVYFYRVTGEDGGIISAGKLVIQH